MCEQVRVGREPVQPVEQSANGGWEPVGLDIGSWGILFGAYKVNRVMDTLPNPAAPSPETEGGGKKGVGQVWRRVLSLLAATDIFHPDEWPVRRLLRRALTLAGVMFLLAVLSQGLARVGENQVGVMVHNVTGRLALKERAGYYIFVPYFSRFYVLDKTIQRLDLTWSQRGSAAGRDIKLKTADGSNVSLDVSISFKLIPEEATGVLRRSGTGARFAELWVEPFARHVAFAAFGRLTTEEMYDAGQRSAEAEAALRDLNTLLRPNGIEVIALVPGEFRFYREYEQVIAEKKLADQKVEEQQSQARALLEDQARRLVEAQNQGQVRLAVVRGETTNRVIEATAAALKTRREADSYFASRHLEAEGTFQVAMNRAEGQRALMLAEAAGLAERRQAMTGEGGRLLVGMEYAKRLESIRMIGSPITREGSVQQFTLQPGERPGFVAPQPAVEAPAMPGLPFTPFPPTP
jgi:regulator of protease activity HflC (stomatin/prohibitin superfamily)